MDHTDPIYKRWIEYREAHGSQPMTNTQWKFATWLFEHADKQLTVLGDLTSVFESVRGFRKEDIKENPPED